MHASFAVRKQKAVRFYGAFMTNATQMQRCGCVCGSQALVCVLPSETSRGGCGHFFGRKKTPTELSDTEFSAREGYESSPTVLVSYTTLAFLLNNFSPRRVLVRYTASCNAFRVINHIAAAA